MQILQIDQPLSHFTECSEGFNLTMYDQVSQVSLEMAKIHNPTNQALVERRTEEEKVQVQLPGSMLEDMGPGFQHRSFEGYPPWN